MSINKTNAKESETFYKEISTHLLTVLTTCDIVIS